MIACFLSNISAKYYTNPSMLSRVIAKNVGDVFLRHSVHSSHYISVAESIGVSLTTFT